ncbi:YKL173Wp-like protein, partial [Saccharomyces cerevisiae AWRI1631]
METKNTQSPQIPLVEPVTERTKLQEHTIFTQLKKTFRRL